MDLILDQLLVERRQDCEVGRLRRAHDEVTRRAAHGAHRASGTGHDRGLVLWRSASGTLPQERGVLRLELEP